MSNFKVGDIVFYKGDEGIIREVMTDGKENFYRVDVSRKSILYLYEDELDLGTQNLNDNQKIVLERLKINAGSKGSLIKAIHSLYNSLSISPGRLEKGGAEELLKARNALARLPRKQVAEVLAAFAQWGLGQEETE